jgi:hypothetical protein
VPVPAVAEKSMPLPDVPTTKLPLVAVTLPAGIIVLVVELLPMVVVFDQLPTAVAPITSSLLLPTAEPTV